MGFTAGQSKEESRMEWRRGVTGMKYEGGLKGGREGKKSGETVEKRVWEINLKRKRSRTGRDGD